MKYYVIESINVDELKDLWDVLTECIKDNMELEITVLSWWWEVQSQQRLVQMINESKVPISIIVIEAQSCAFQLLLDLKKSIPIRVIDTWFCMIHQWEWSVKMKEWWTTSNYGRFQIKHLETHLFDISYLTDEEKIQYNRWECIYMDAIRTREILANKKD